MDSKDALALIKQVSRLADAVEESNKLKKKELVIEKKKFRVDYLTESDDSQSEKDGEKGEV